jgi:hypothetical protein
MTEPDKATETYLHEIAQDLRARLAAAERFVAAWDRSMDVATAHAMSGYIRNTPEQRREAEEAWQAVLDARAELDWGGQPKEPSTYALRPTTFAPGRRVPGRT